MFHKPSPVLIDNAMELGRQGPTVRDRWSRWADQYVHSCTFMNEAEKTQVLGLFASDRSEDPSIVKSISKHLLNPTPRPSFSCARF